ncbi:hypothetical protein D3C75_868440 [compost metagenome]
MLLRQLQLPDPAEPEQAEVLAEQAVGVQIPLPAFHHQGIRLHQPFRRLPVRAEIVEADQTTGFNTLAQQHQFLRIPLRTAPRGIVEAQAVHSLQKPGISRFFPAGSRQHRLQLLQGSGAGVAGPQAGGAVQSQQHAGQLLLRQHRPVQPEAFGHAKPAPCTGIGDNGKARQTDGVRIPVNGPHRHAKMLRQLLSLHLPAVGQKRHHIQQPVHPHIRSLLFFRYSVRSLIFPQRRLAVSA